MIFHQILRVGTQHIEPYNFYMLSREKAFPNDILQRRHDFSWVYTIEMEDGILILHPWQCEHVGRHGWPPLLNAALNVLCGMENCPSPWKYEYMFHPRK